MTSQITRDILESYLSCPTKAHLKLQGQQGVISDYDGLLAACRREVRRIAIDKILARHPPADVAMDAPLVAVTLRRGSAFMLNATLADELLTLTFDGLMRVDGSSKLGDFHYVPVLFHEASRIGKTQRLLLEVHALLLSKLQERIPANGIIWHGKDCKATRVRLVADVRRAERHIGTLREMSIAQAPPTLILSDHCKVCEFRQPCKDRAMQEDNISLLRGIGEKEVKSYAKKGIFTVTQLAHTFRPRRKRKQAAKTQTSHYPALQALAIRDKKIYVFGTPELPKSSVQIYFDIEGTPDEKFVYLIGMVVVNNGSETRYSFWADDKEQEPVIFGQFVDEVTHHDDFVLFCYGSYEKAFLKRMRNYARRKKPVDKMLSTLVNVLSVVYSHVYFPSYSNGLKDVAACLGCSWTEAKASGIQSLVWRANWEASHADEWKKKLVEYNSEDCTALKAITGCIVSLRDSSFGSLEQNQTMPRIAWAHEVSVPSVTHEWFRKNALIPDLNYVNQCAFFDYQRSRVYLRTNVNLKRLAKARANRKKSLKASLPKRSVNKRIDCLCKKCPHCKSSNIRRCKRATLHTKYEVHLKLSRSGINRYITEYFSQQYRCLDCERRFLPLRFKRRTRRDKFTHAFRSWVIYHHLRHRTSFEGIHDIIRDFFGLRVYHRELYSFQSQLAKYYRNTYEQILATLTAGSLVHADETSAKVRASGGYVWVLASMEEVIYMYHESREGDFIQAILREFHGVLVSDFYSAYESIDCSQQKCLVHLIRDLNDDLLGHPYNDELTRLVHGFAHLLSEIVTTVDRHGLKRRFLSKHEKDTERFFTALTQEQFSSDIAEGYKKRFLKYRNEMFTFLRHDGVPWNNNNAEHAVKSFAQYRTISGGLMTESGLKDYLVLLSIQQTCRYRGISFLRFLLSGDKDIDQYCGGLQKKRKPFGD